MELIARAQLKGMEQQRPAAVSASIRSAQSLSNRTSPQRKRRETKLASYNYENKPSSQRNFAPTVHNLGESKRPFIPSSKFAESISQAFVAKHFAFRVRHRFDAAFIR
jgi:hypothetical protein